jgi:type I restriction enzyme S subunit
MAFEISELLNNKALPADWTAGLVGDIAKVNSKSISKKSPPKVIQYLDISSVGTRVFEMPKVLEYSKAPSRAQRVVRDGDTLIATVRPNLRAFAYITKADENLIASTGFACVSANDKNDSRYLHYFLTCEPFIQHLIRFADGAAYPAFDCKLIPLAEIPLPPQAERKNIGQFLGALDDRIDLLRNTNKTLEAVAQALFKSWFVDFDPVRAKSEGKLPEGMDEATAAFFPDAFEETELGLVPRGWQLQKFGDFIERLSVGKKFDQKSALVEGVVPILDQGKSGIIGFHNEAPSVIANPDTPVVVFANHTCYMRLICFDFSAIQNVLPFIGKGVDTVWAFYATKDRIKFSEYKGHWPDFTIEKTVVPSEELTLLYRRFVDSAVRRMRLNEMQAETLAKLRDTLLPRLISGQLRITDVETECEKVTA